MFDLEKSIAEWRKEMFVAGIKAPVPLEELEIHLREEIERQLKSGVNLEHAFENSARIIGGGNALKSEFRKIQDTTRSNRILALLWLIGSLWSVNTMIHRFALNQFWKDRPLFFINSLVTFIYITGAFGSLLLFRGRKIGVGIIRSSALLFLIACLAESLVNFGAPIKLQTWWIACAVFCIVSIWQLHLPKNLKPVA